MKNRFLFVFFLSLSTPIVFAQGNFGGNSTTIGGQLGQVQLQASPEIDQLVEVRIQHSMRNPKVRGLRVQIIQNTDRQLVTKEKTKFLRLFPNMKIYESYDQPFFKLRVGDFENRFDAYRVYQTLKPMFNSVFVVPDMVKASEL